MLDATPVELAAAALSAGFDFIGVRIVSPDTGEAFGELIASATARRELRARTADLPGGVLDVEAFWLRPETDVLDFRPALEAAAELGARHVLTVGHDPDGARLRQNVARFADLAAQVELTLAIEPITYCAISDVHAAAALIAEVGRDDVRILVDALQFFRSGVPLTELASIKRSLLPYAQIADGPARAPETLGARRQEARLGRRVPGRGAFDLRGWIDALTPGIPLAVEVPSDAVRALPRPEAAMMLRAAVERLLDDR